MGIENDKRLDCGFVEMEKALMYVPSILTDDEKRDLRRF